MRFVLDAGSGIVWRRSSIPMPELSVLVKVTTSIGGPIEVSVMFRFGVDDRFWLYRCWFRIERNNRLFLCRCIVSV